jgi:hypothetical protein
MTKGGCSVHPLSMARISAATNDPADLVSVVRVILHHKTTYETVAAPTELVSVAPASHQLDAGGIRCTRFWDALDQSTSDESHQPTRVRQIFKHCKLADDPATFRISVP